MEKTCPRVLVYPNDQTELRWSKRKSWLNGGESIYSLLAKFAQLNALTNRELCKLFVNPTESIAQYPRYPVIDLRFGDRMRVGQVINILGINTAEIDTAFVDRLFPNSVQLSSPNLIWCPKCAQHGFHTAVFQLNSYVICPAHRTPLRRTCGCCSQLIPYSLKSSGHGLFSCIHCGSDLAKGLRTHQSSLGLSQLAVTAHREFSQLVSFLDTLPTLINACKARLGQPNVSICLSKADLNGRGQAYRHFVTNVLCSLNSKVLTSQLLPILPTSVFSSQGVMHGQQLDSLDSGIAQAQSLYRSTKRHIYRHMCRGHKKCIHAVQKALWWDMEGEKTPVFCPTALAFLRWRMHWEGCRIPCMLDSTRRLRVFTGLIGWLAADAPFGSFHWTRELSGWLNSQLLAYALVDSFAEWRRVVEKAQSRQSFAWDRSVVQSFGKRHWACCGRGTAVSPALFFVEPAYLKMDPTARASKSHIRNTRSLLSIVHR